MNGPSTTKAIIDAAQRTGDGELQAVANSVAAEVRTLWNVVGDRKGMVVILDNYAHPQTGEARRIQIEERQRYIDAQIQSATAGLSLCSEAMARLNELERS